MTNHVRVRALGTLGTFGKPGGVPHSASSCSWTRSPSLSVPSQLLCIGTRLVRGRAGTGLSSDASGFFQRNGRSCGFGRREKHDTTSNVGVCAPAGVGHYRTGLGSGAHPVADDPVLQVQGAERAPNRRRKLPIGQERAMGDTDGGNPEDSAEMHRQARPAGMVEPCRVDEQHVGYDTEPGHSRGEDRALSQGKQAGRVRGRSLSSHHRLVFDVRGTARTCSAGTSEHVVRTPVWLSLPAHGARAGPPRHRGGPSLVAGMSLARLASGEGDETPADDRGSRQFPWRSGQCGFGVLGQCHLEPDQLVAGLRPWRCRLFHPVTIAPRGRGRRTNSGSTRLGSLIPGPSEGEVLRRLVQMTLSAPAGLA